MVVLLNKEYTQLLQQIHDYEEVLADIAQGVGPPDIAAERILEKHNPDKLNEVRL